MKAPGRRGVGQLEGSSPDICGMGAWLFAPQNLMLKYISWRKRVTREVQESGRFYWPKGTVWAELHAQEAKATISEPDLGAPRAGAEPQHGPGLRRRHTSRSPMVPEPLREAEELGWQQPAVQGVSGRWPLGVHTQA